MTKIPLSIAKYLRGLWMSDMVITYFLVDNQGNLAQWSGYPRYYGLTTLTAGQPVTEQLVFLEGLLPVEYTEILNFVEVNPEGSVAHIHLIPSASGTWILLIDAQIEHERQQKMQQQYNELNLLHYRQSQVLQQLEDARHTLLEEKTQLEQTIASKTHLLSTLSHELRTPISSIIGYTELLDQIEQTDKTESDYLVTVKRNASHLLNLVDNILDEAKLEMGKITLRPEICHLAEMVRDLKNLFYPLVHEKALNFAVEINANVPGKLVIDELRFRQILINLINNAIKFTSQGSIKLRFHWENDYLHFAVTDTGVGIATESLHKIFTAFHREASALRQAGAGLGLTICHHLLTLMEGQLEVESELGKGSTFSGRIKATPGYPKTQSTVSTPTNLDNRPFKVMIVDDDTIICMILETYLKENGYDIMRATDSDEAIELVTCYQPDLILMDVNMPNLTGYETVKLLRKQHVTIPILALSASTFEHDRNHALQSGYNDYLTKPVSIEEVLTKLQYYLK